jgi:signal transduction histidine kinase
VLLAMAASLPLLAARRAPLAAYLVLAGATSLLLALRYPLDFPFGLVAGVYALAYTTGGDSRRLRRWAAWLAAGAYVPVATAVYIAHGDRLVSNASGMLFWALAFLGAWLAGDLTRVRQERLAELEERAARAERDAERERSLAAAQERTRIARELHDSAGHAINVILVQAGAARLLHGRDPAGSIAAITTIEDVARDTVGEIDRLVRALREDSDVPPADPRALQELLDRHRAGGLNLVTDVRGTERDLPGSVAWAAYRILQEALTNATRHGRGSAEVAVCFGASDVEITVTNPASPRVATGGGHGIVGMRERAAILGGTLEAGVERDVFRLRARLPLPEAAR